jgi:cytochrome c oxidase assembly protein subunit 15
MVRSGLKEELLVHDQPRVSPYRLTVHLCSAFIIYMLLLDTAMKLWPTASSKAVVEAGKKLPLLARTIVPPRFRYV